MKLDTSFLHVLDRHFSSSLSSFHFVLDTMIDQTEFANATVPPTEPEQLIDQKLDFQYVTFGIIFCRLN